MTQRPASSKQSAASSKTYAMLQSAPSDMPSQTSTRKSVELHVIAGFNSGTAETMVSGWSSFDTPLLSRVRVRVQRRFVRVFFFPRRYGEPRFLQKNMKLNFIIEGTLNIFIVQHPLKANWKNWLNFAVLSRIFLKSCKMNISSKSQIQ